MFRLPSQFMHDPSGTGAQNSRIAFTAAGSTYTGQVSGDAMEGTQGGSGGKWQATRAK